MLTRPDVADDELMAQIQAEYGLDLAAVTFLPLGADLNTAAFRASAADGSSYFLKLRRGAFAPASVMLPRHLHDQGIEQVVAPLATKNGRLWAEFGQFRIILYPFVEGQNAYAVRLTDRQWVQLGAAVRRIHSTPMPSDLTALIPMETFAPQWRDNVALLLARADADDFDTSESQWVSTFLKSHRHTILELIRRAGALALDLKAQPPRFIVCHSDIHAGNILINTEGALFVVDWDEPIHAPKERDLMYIAGGLMANTRHPAEEARLFYQGYGRAYVDQTALAYYRYERIIVDIAVDCALILDSYLSAADREQSKTYLASNFLPGKTIAIAGSSDKTRFGSMTLPGVSPD